MPAPFDIIGYAYTPGATLRASWTNGDSGTITTQLALTEAFAGVNGVSIYSGTSNVAAPDSILRPYLCEIRTVTAQTNVSFSSTNSGVLAPPTDVGYLKLGQWTPSLLLNVAVSSVPQGTPSTGTGTTAVDHNTGGADLLRFVFNAGSAVPDGIDGAAIRAYTLSDWNAGNRAVPYILGQSTTGVVGGLSGRWLRPIYLTANGGSNSYVIEFDGGGSQTVTNQVSI